jgi:hypothetical protein
MKHPAIDTCVDRILKMVPIAPEESGDGPPRGIALTPKGEQIIDGLRPYPEEIEEAGDDTERDDLWLGQHFPMSSPGRIDLHWQRLGSCFWHHLRGLLGQGYYLESAHLRPLATLVVANTFHHELFHHYADAISRLTHVRRVFPEEEALAVAWSYHAVLAESNDGRTVIGRLPRPASRAFLLRMYRYRAPGYRDWVHFQTPDAFDDGLAAYLVESAGERLLRHNLIDTSAIVKGMAGAIGVDGADIRVV